LTVLLIDDNPVQLQARAGIVRFAGLQVFTETNAQDALELLEAPSDPEITGVVTDHNMPGTNGVEFVRRLRQFNPTIPVLVLSGSADAEREYDGLNVLFRQKPCPPNELIELLRATLSYNQHVHL
jgi:CheY-like chemotaxis protein